MRRTTDADGADAPPAGDAVDWMLIREAREVRPRAYAPYSRYRVGAALRGGDGRVYVGCNVENAAYPQGQCAEAGAIAAMVAGGCTRIVAIAVAGPGDAPCAPCGGCRQKIAEFASGASLLHMAGEAGTDVVSWRVDAMLPARFTLPPEPPAADAAGRQPAG